MFETHVHGNMLTILFACLVILPYLDERVLKSLLGEILVDAEYCHAQICKCQVPHAKLTRRSAYASED